MIVKLSDDEIKDVSILDVNKDNYIVPENEKNLYHCIIEIRRYDNETGKRLSIPRLQKFGIKAFEANVYEFLLQQGYTVDILYNPTNFVKQEEVNRQKTAEQLELEKLEQFKKAELEAKKAEDERIKAAVAEALAQQAKEFEAKLADEQSLAAEPQKQPKGKQPKE